MNKYKFSIGKELQVDSIVNQIKTSTGVDCKDGSNYLCTNWQNGQMEVELFTVTPLTTVQKNLIATQVSAL